MSPIITACQHRGPDPAGGGLRGAPEPRPLRHRRPPLGQRPPRPRRGETALLKLDGVYMIVFVLRHADRTEAGDLKHPEGTERAELLGRMLADSGLSVAFRSQYVRAEKTLARLKEQLGNALKVRTISFLDTEDAEAYGRRVADAVKALPATAVVAVVGHS